MSIKPIFDCLLCCDERIVMKKISHEALCKLSEFQFKPFIGQLHQFQDLHITPFNHEVIAPIPKVKHWAYLRRRQHMGIDTAPEPERSLFRKEILQAKITYESVPYDVYNPVFSSEEDEEEDEPFSFSEEEIKLADYVNMKKLKKQRKKHF